MIEFSRCCCYPHFEDNIIKNNRFVVSGSQLQACKWQDYNWKTGLFDSRIHSLMLSLSQLFEFIELLLTIIWGLIFKFLVHDMTNVSIKLPNTKTNLLITSFKWEIQCIDIVLWWIMTSLWRSYYPQNLSSKVNKWASEQTSVWGLFFLISKYSRVKNSAAKSPLWIWLPSRTTPLPTTKMFFQRRTESVYRKHI